MNHASPNEKSHHASSRRPPGATRPEQGCRKRLTSYNAEAGAPTCEPDQWLQRVCVDMHARELKKSNESDERLFAVAAWRDAPYFTDAERAALALTEAVTRLSDRPDPVPDEI